MSEYRVGGAYVDLYLKGMDKYQKQIDTATKKLADYATQIEKLEKKKRELRGLLSESIKSSGATSKETKDIKKQLKDLEEEEKNLRKAFKETNADLEKQVKTMITLGKNTKNVIKVEKQAKEIQSLGDAAEYSAGKFSNLLSLTNLLKGALIALSARELYEFLIEPNAEMEQYIVQFTTLLGSLEEAEYIMQDIIQIAKKTPFETPDVADAIETLSQYGVAQDNLIPKFNQLADLSKGNAENLNNIALAYGRIMNSGKITLQQLNIMIRRGVPIMQAFADVTGKTTGELYKMIRNGELAVEVFDEAIDSLTKNGGRFEGLVNEQSKTLTGRISTLKDDITFIGKDIGEATFERLSGYINDIIAEIERLEATGELKEITDGIGGAISELVETLADVIKWLYEHGEAMSTVAIYAISFANAMNLATKSMQAFKIVGEAAKFTKLNVAVAGLSAAITVLIKGLNDLEAAEAKLAGTANDLIEKSEKSRDLYNKEVEATNAYAKRARNLNNELQDLISIENKSEEQKLRIKRIIDELNLIYPDLNLQYSAERDELNKNIQTFEDYIAAIERTAKIKSSESLYESNIQRQQEIQNEIDSIITQLNEAKEKDKILDEALNKSILPLPEFFKLQKMHDENERNIAIWEQALQGLNFEYNNIADENKELMNSWEKLFEEEKNAADGALETVATYESLNSELDTLASNIENTAGELADSSSQTTTELENMVDGITELTAAMQKNSSEASFSLDEATSLIQKYPDLASAIYATTDGYKFQSDVLSQLTSERVAYSNEYINSIQSNLQKELDGINAQISAYNGESEAIEELKKRAAELQTQILSLSLLTAPWQTMLQMAQSTTGTEKKKTTYKGVSETYDEKLIRNLKFKYDMGIIDAENYYNELEKIKEKYYKDGSKKWQQYTLEVKRGREKIEEEQRKAAEAEFKNTIAGMRERIEDAEFYETKSKDEIIKDLNDIRQYILKSYLDRKIDYENFAEQLREIDKDIYSQEKELLEENIDEMNELRNKKYDEAVKKINDYYEAIERAQKNAEREQELRELRETAELYEGAVSRAGQQKLKELQSDIRELEKEKLQDKLENQREYHLENLDAKYQALEESQNEYFSTVQNGIKTTAQIVEEYTKQINTFFAQVNGVMKIQRALNEPIVNNLTLNQNITDASSNRAAIDITKIISSYGFK